MPRMRETLALPELSLAWGRQPHTLGLERPSQPQPLAKWEDPAMAHTTANAIHGSKFWLVVPKACGGAGAEGLQASEDGLDAVPEPSVAASGISTK